MSTLKPPVHSFPWVMPPFTGWMPRKPDEPMEPDDRLVAISNLSYYGMNEQDPNTCSIMSSGRSGKSWHHLAKVVKSLNADFYPYYKSNGKFRGTLNAEFSQPLPLP